jgi:hypothetical protein
MIPVELQSMLFGEMLPNTIQILIAISPIFLAIILYVLFWPLWVNYVRSDFIANMKYTLLEIKLPKEMLKSPLSMELVLNALHNTSDGSNFAQFWKGEKRPTYSLELVSVEGVVKFFIRTEDRRKNGVMAALYSQFPGIEVHEAPDYTHGIHFDPKESKLWGADFKFTQKNDVLPIKTYVDYGLDKDPKEEFKVDPMTPMIEFLGSVGPNQQVWFQFMIRAHTAEQAKPGHLWKKTDAYKDQAQEFVNKLMVRDAKTRIVGKKDKETGRVIPPTLTDGEKELIKAVERNMGKLAFDVGIRAVYIGKKDVFDKPNGVGGILSAFKHFSSENFNGIKQNGDKYSAKFSGLPWEDYKKYRENKQCRLVLEAYKRRSFFYEPFTGTPLVLSTEELATLYHFPGAVASTPNLNRIPSKKSQAPANLPI